jgi:4Fe-4S single cluster protein
VSDHGASHRKNVAGPFYVLNECCTACGVPTSIAPELFEFDSTDHCYVKRQPASDAELEQALQVVRIQELDCIRYGGTDARILRRLAEAGDARLCDHPLPGVGPVLRNVVTFEIQAADEASADPAILLEQFAKYAQRQIRHVPVRTKPIVRGENEASFALAWFDHEFHPIAIRRLEMPHRILILHRGILGVSELLDGWLRSVERFTQIRWYSEDSWNRSGEWRPRPW